MPTLEFNAQTQNKLKPTSKFVEYLSENFDCGYPGSLGLRISPADKRTWFIRYRSDGKSMKYTLGQYPAMNYSEAKQVASDKLKAIAEGGDPSHERKRRTTAPTVAELWEKYTDKRDDKYDEKGELKKNPKPLKAKKTIDEENRYWEKDIEPAIGGMKVEDVKPVDLSDLLEGIARRSRSVANRTHSLLQVLFKPGLSKGWIEIHPMQWIDKPGGTEAPRTRVLSDDEIRAIWPVLDRLKGNPRDILKLGLLTGQRPGEIASMRWENIDLDEAVWSQPTNKTNVYHVVPLSEQVIEILFSKRKKSGWVFPSNYNRSRGAETAGHTTSLKEARKRVKQWSGTEGWTSHDLRRTARTLMATIGIDEDIAERVVNHSTGSKMSRTYNRYRYLKEKRAALQKLANKIDSITGTVIRKATVTKINRKVA